MRPELVFIGIDPGVKTGVAMYDSLSKSLIGVKTLKIHVAMNDILGVREELYNAGIAMFVRVEDARLRKWFGETGSEVWQGAGSVKRDCKIWEDFLTDWNIAFELVAPRNNFTKISAKQFKQITGYEGGTSEHARAAAMLVWGFSCDKAVKEFKENKSKKS